MKNKVLTICVYVLAGLLMQTRVWGQDDWKLKSEKDGIFIYLRTFPDSKFKAVRVVVELDASLSQMVAVLMDVEAGVDWVYATKSCKLLKQVSPSELYYYSEVNIPWPAANRDFIAHLSVVQDAKTKVVTVYGPTVPEFVPMKKDIVRILHSEGKWIVSPSGAHKVKVEYTLRVDPGGNLPAWLVNLFAAKGPYESFTNLRRQLRKPVYVNARLPYITE